MLLHSGAEGQYKRQQGWDVARQGAAMKQLPKADIKGKYRQAISVLSLHWSGMTLGEAKLSQSLWLQEKSRAKSWNCCVRDQG